MIEIEFEIARNGCPEFDSDVFPWHNDSTRMSLGVAIATQGHGFALVVVVEIEGVLKCFFWVAIEFPEPNQNMVKVNDMVAFKVVSLVADETTDSFVSEHPVIVDFRCSNLPFNFSYGRIGVHNTLYA